MPLVSGDASALFSLVGDGSVENMATGSYRGHSTRRRGVHMDVRKRAGIRESVFAIPGIRRPEDGKTAGI